MSLHLDERADGGFALYIDGDFQFDTADEALYHESMALPALCLARKANPLPLRVLICGGGDGLALRECLRFPGVASADLVDYDPAVVNMGRERFAELNAHAFEDPRVAVHIADAWEFLTTAEPYDLIICDFTVPRRQEDTRIFSLEWYEKLQTALTPEGILALNALSPQITPEAFWCLRKTVRASGLSALPYHVCIPSFRTHGYGAWAFLLASPQPLTQRQLRDLDCPVSTRQADMTKLWRGARFHRAERQIEKQVPVHTLDSGCLLPLVLNPNLPRQREWEQNASASTPYDLGPLLRTIPILHPYHTRTMIEMLAEQVVGTIRALDIRQLVDALLRRAAKLPGELRAELLRLRDFLKESASRFETFGQWSYKLFATLVILMTLANAIAPDNAFAKGGEGGVGHGGSMSRGSGSFGGSRGFSTSGRSSSGSFSGSRGIGTTSASGSRGSFGGGAASGARSSFSGSRSFGQGSIYSGSGSIPHTLGTGFRSSYGRGGGVDITGRSYPARTFYYTHSSYGYVHSYSHVYGGVPSGAAPEPHQAFFVANTDMFVLENGDVVISLSDSAYLLLSNGSISLMNQKSPDPLMALYPDPVLFQNVQAQLLDQQAGVQQAGLARQDWLSWVGWTQAMLPTIAEDRAELNNLMDLNRRLDAALSRLGAPPAAAQPTNLQQGQVELFFGGLLLPDGSVALRGPDGQTITTDGKRLWKGEKEHPSEIRACPTLLRTALRSVLLKLQKEDAGTLASDNNDLSTFASDLQSLQKDMADYTAIQQANSYDPEYTVDYGTEEIPVTDALSRTQRDLDQNAKDTKDTQTEIDRLTAEQDKITQALILFQP